MTHRSLPHLIATASRRDLEASYALLKAALADAPPGSSEYSTILNLLDQVERALSGLKPNLTPFP